MLDDVGLIAAERVIAEDPLEHLQGRVLDGFTHAAMLAAPPRPGLLHLGLLQQSLQHDLDGSPLGTIATQ